ncbi:MAG TPA: branched-chain amino acid ABC transporter permease [Candidatus Dormibacteraeota bacterium]|nr:branched-chain amino acid ABC transporter permease [Candidatus Dormibacteraeota bacterium]
MLSDNVNALVIGVAIGSVYGLIAIGYSIVYAATRVFNLGQGDLITVGVLLSYYLLVVAGWVGLAAFAAIVASVAIISVIEERVVVRPALRRADSIGWFITTLAFGVIVRNIYQNLYGNAEARAIPSPLSSKAIQIGSVVISPQELLAIIALLAITVAVELFYHRTWWGHAMRATSEDRDTAALRGIDPGRVGLLAFAIGGCIAGIAGYVLGPILFSDVNEALSLSLKGFLAIAIGGFGSIRGALLGAWALGMTEQMVDLHSSAAYEPVAGLGLVLLVLIVRPTGIFGGAAEREV